MIKGDQSESKDAVKKRGPTINGLLGHIEVAGDHAHCNVLIVGRHPCPVLGKQRQEVVVKYDIIPARHQHNLNPL